MLNVIFNYIAVILWRSVLLVEETGVPGENHRPAASHWQALSYNVVSTTLRHKRIRTLVTIGTDCIGSCKSNYNIFTATTSLIDNYIVPFVMVIYCNKNVDIKCSATRFWNHLHKVRSKSKDWKTKLFKKPK